MPRWWPGKATPFIDWRDDPKSHQWLEPCGQREGTDTCWLCSRPQAEHPTPEAPDA